MTPEDALQIMQSLLKDLSRSNFLTPEQFGVVNAAWETLHPAQPASNGRGPVLAEVVED